MKLKQNNLVDLRLKFCFSFIAVSFYMCERLKPFSVSNGTTTLTNLRCFNCNQLNHTRKLCPNRTQGNSSYTTHKVVTTARIQAYTRGKIPEVSVTRVTSDSGVSKGVPVQSLTAPNSDSGRRRMQA